MNCIVTCDEKWILYDNRKRSAQLVTHDEAPQYFSKSMLHQKKAMMTVWYSQTGLIHYNFLNPGETITATNYCQEKWRKAPKKRTQKRAALVNGLDSVLVHDNIRPQVALSFLQKLVKLGFLIYIFFCCILNQDLLSSENMQNI